MKKDVYTIGRDESCDIVIPDNTDIISRLHAIITIGSNNKIYIKDQSLNGTYINGMKMSQDVEIPISRADVVSFAHIYNLDWSLIPKRRSKWKLILIIVLVVAFLAGIVYFICRYQNKESVYEPVQDLPRQIITIPADTVVITDTVLVEPEPADDMDSSLQEEPEEILEKEEVYNPIY